MNEVLTVEDEANRGFCSEICIEQFFVGAKNILADFESDWRTKLKVQEDSHFTSDYINQLSEKTASEPDEIWLDQNELGEKIYFCIKMHKLPSGEGIYNIIATLMLDDEASYIFFKTMTQSIKLKKKFERGEQIKLELGHQKQGDVQEIIIDQETAEAIEQKRSNLLAVLIENKSETDIPLEKFGLYEGYLQPTLESPDEVYQYKDDSQDTIVTHIKSFSENDVAFFYFVVCQKLPEKKKQEQVMLPILSFPSIDARLYSSYKKGEKISGVLKN